MNRHKAQHTMVVDVHALLPHSELKGKKRIVQLKLLLPALCKSPQSGSEETYTSLTKPRTDEGKCALSALCSACAHTRSACGVCFECSPFVCVSGSVLSAFQTFRARYSPATTPTCQLICSSSSSPSLHSSLCLSLFFGRPLMNGTPGDEVTVAVTARSHRLLWGSSGDAFLYQRKLPLQVRILSFSSY